MRHVTVFLLLLGLTALVAADCHHVEKGAHYDSLIPFHGFHTGQVYKQRVKFDNNTKFVFPPTEEKGALCQSSWNKLYGASRCYNPDPHSNSDRFVWRRPLSCFTFKDGKVVGEIPDCPLRDMMELAAYTYDHGLKPFEHIGTLLKEFKTLVKIGEWVNLEIDLDVNRSTYKILSSNGTIVETQIIDRKDCSSGPDSFLFVQSLYFGGQCPAPQRVDVCYEDYSKKRN